MGKSLKILIPLRISQFRPILFVRRLIHVHVWWHCPFREKTCVRSKHWHMVLGWKINKIFGRRGWNNMVFKQKVLFYSVKMLYYNNCFPRRLGATACRPTAACTRQRSSTEWAASSWTGFRSTSAWEREGAMWCQLLSYIWKIWLSVQ